MSSRLESIRGFAAGFPAANPALTLDRNARRARAIASAIAPVGALVLASLLWGTADVAGKLALTAIPPATLAALRFGVALAILWPLARWRRLVRPPARVTAPLGLLGVALAFLFQNFGLRQTSATNASLLQGAGPIFILLLAAIVLGEPLGLRRVVAATAALAGVATVSLAGGDGLRPPGAGDLLVLASAGCFAGFVILGRRGFPIYGTLPVLAGMAAWGTAALLPVAAIEVWQAPRFAIDGGHVALVLYLGVGCSALTYGLWGFALSRVEAGRAAVFDALIPVAGVGAATVVLSEMPVVWQLAGGALVVGGVLVAVFEPRSVDRSVRAVAETPEPPSPSELEDSVFSLVASTATIARPAGAEGMLYGTTRQ